MSDELPPLPEPDAKICLNDVWFLTRMRAYARAAILAALAEQAEEIERLKRELWDAQTDADNLRAEKTRLQMELDASCNAEELRQVRAEAEALRGLLREARQAFPSGHWNTKETNELLARIDAKLGESK